MSHNHRNCRNRQSTQVAVSAVAEIVEPRMLLSAAPVLQTASTAGADTTGTKELEIVAIISLSGFNTTESLKIDEIRLVGDEVQVFSTRNYGAVWPGQTRWAYVDSDPKVQSSPVTVTVPDRELKVVYFFANIDQPQSELYYLRTFGTSTQLYRRADADGDTGWMTTDVDPGTGSTVGLDFTDAPAAPTGLVSSAASTTSNDVTLWFDESPASAIAGQRFVRQYNLRVQSNGNYVSISGPTDLVAFDSQRFSMTDASGMVKTFGGRRTVNLPVGVYSWSVQVRDLPVFPDGTTGTNALATPWSEFSGPARFAVLSQGEQIAVGQPVTSRTTGIATVEWGPVAGAASYEVWINRVSNGAMLLHKTGLSGSSYQTDALDPDNYRVWVRATRTDGTRTSWSKPKDFTVNAYVNIVRVSGNSEGEGLLGGSFGTVHDTTPTITWTAVPRSTQYKISLIDTAKKGAGTNDEVCITRIASKLHHRLHSHCGRLFVVAYC